MTFAQILIRNTININLLQIIRLFFQNLARKLSFSQLASLMDALFKYYEGSMENFISQARNEGDNNLIKIRLVPSSMPEYPGYWHVLDNFAVKHIMHRHSGNRERLRGQEPVTLTDFFLIIQIVLEADSIQPTKCANGNQGLIYTKKINDEIYTLIEEVRKGHSELAATTLYKRKKKLTDAKSPI